MSNTIFRQEYSLQNAGIHIDFRQNTQQYFPAHWHPYVELIYLISGRVDLILEGTIHRMIPGEALVVDISQIHELKCEERSNVIITYIDEEFISLRLGRFKDFRLLCSRDELTPDVLDDYFYICGRFKDLVAVHEQNLKGHLIEEESIVMDILYHLICNFSFRLYRDDLPEPAQNQKRMREIVSYIDEHYAEPISLEQIAAHFGLSREYFSRMFRKNIGIPFTQHVNHVRIAHIHHDLVTTDTPVMEILDKNGFTNYKLFSKMFRELYCCTPRELRARLRNDE